MKKLLLLWLFVLFNIMSSWGQVEIGTGTSVQRYPMGGYYGFERSASIYTSAEVQSIGNIQQLGWYANLAGAGSRPIKVYLKETTASVNVTGTWSNLIAGATLVYDGALDPLLGWNILELTAAFNYSGGANNLMVLVEANYGDTGNGGATTGNSVRYTTATGKHFILEKDTSPPTDANSGSVSNNRPNIKIVFGPVITCAGPSVFSNIVSSTRTISFTVQPSATVPAMGYEYEARTSGNPGSGPTGLAASAPFTDLNVTITGLAPSTLHTIYVRSKCSATDFGTWKSFEVLTGNIGQIGEGESTTATLPLRPNWGYNYTQQIYLNEEVANAVEGNHLITKIKFHIQSTTATTSYKDWRIYMGNTDQVEFATGSSWVPQNRLSQVFDGVVTFPNPTNGWMEIELATPFIWDGVSNLVIAVHEYTPGFQNGAVFRSMGTTGKRGLGVANDSTDMNPNDLATGTTYTHVPQLILVGQELPVCMYPSNIQSSELGTSSVKYNWHINGTNPRMATEYYLSNSPTVPLPGTVPTGTVNEPGRELSLSGLTADTQYYIWFRVKCNATTNSEWSPVDAFKTNVLGQIGSGNSTTTQLPLRSNIAYNYSQQIYLKAEVAASVGTNNVITKVKFHFKSDAATANYKDWKIFMGNTSQSEFETSSSWVAQSRLTEVFAGVVTFPTPTDNWMEIELTTPYIWDGESNLVIAVHEHTAGLLAGATFKRMDTEGKRGMITGSTTNPNPANLTTGTSYNYVPQLILEGRPAPTCLYPLTVESSALTSNSVKYTWVVVGTNPYIGTEYFYSTTPTIPTQTTVPTGIVNQPLSELSLTGLDGNTQYYIWFRVKCNATTNSEWSATSSFTTYPTGQIGVGVQTSNMLPIRAGWGYNYSQQIYLKAEVAGAIGTSNLVTKVKFHFKSTNSTATYKDWKIFMGNTAQTAFETTTSWVDHSSLSEVFNGEVTFPTPSDNWMEIELASPFVWDGVSNIVIAVHEFTPGFQGGAVFRKIDTEGNRGMITGTDSVNPDPLNLTPGTAPLNYVPQVTLVSQDLPACMYPTNVSSSNLHHNSVKYTWDVYGTNPYIGTEYYVSTLAAAPTPTTVPNGIVNSPTRELTLNGLNQNTQYYIWFRVKCNGTTNSQWTNVYKFKTYLIGQIGVGEVVGSELPIRSNQAYNYSQQIYLKNEITAAVGTDNVITKIKFHFKSAAATANYKDWKVFIGNTEQSEFATGTSWVPQNQLEQVFDGVVSFNNPTEGDWMEIELTTPFIWDGVSNLVVAVNEYTPGLLAGAVFRKIDTATKRGMGVFGTTNPNLQSLNAGTSLNYVPQIVLIAEPAPPCVGPLSLMFDSVTNNTVKYTWTLFGSAPIVGVEYYLSTTDTTPAANAERSGIFDGRVTEGTISDLNANTRYYIWFRVKCNPQAISEWTTVSTFQTTPNGLIGTGETTSISLPINSTFAYNYSQQIYLASEVAGAVGTDRYIKKIIYHFKSAAATANYKDWKIYMGNTAKAEFAGLTAAEWIPTSGLTTVFNGVVNFPTDVEGQWMEITLAEPFLWDGTSNIVVGVYENTPLATAGANFRKMDTPTFRGLLYRVSTDASNPNPDNPPAASERFKYVPQMAFVAETAPACIGVSSSSYSDLTVNSVKLQWTNTLTTMVGTEYFYTTNPEQVPTAATPATGTVNAPTLFANIVGLTADTQYYVWFRNKCDATNKSAWSVYPITFKTPIRGFIGGGTTTTTQLPLTSSWGYNYSQQIYLAREVISSIGADGQNYITKLKFHFRSASATANYKDWQIFMGNTTKDAFGPLTVQEWIPQSDLQEVFNGVVTFPVPTDNWMEITLNDPFPWDGTSNLVIAVNEYTPAFQSGANFRKMDTPGAKRGVTYYDDVSPFNLATPVAPKAGYEYVPQIMIESSALPTCIKPLRVRIEDIAKNTATVKWDASITIPALGYEYEIRTAGAAGSGAVGRFATELLANTILSKALTGLAPSTEYSVYLRSKCTTTNNSQWTLVKTFTTKCNYTDFTVRDYAICGQGIVNLSVTVTGTTGTFRWYDVATGGTVLSQGLTFTTPLLTANKSYWVEGSTGPDNDLCLSGRKKIDIVVSAAPAFALSTAALTICEGETSALVTVTSDLSAYSTYTWSPAAGVSGNAQTGWAFNPATTTVYTLIAKQASGDLCEVSKTVTVKVNPLPVVTFLPTLTDLVVCEGETTALEVEYPEDFQSTIGTGTAVSAKFDNNTAFNNRFTAGKSQLLFTAAELNQHGVGAGNITSVSFNIQTPGSRLTNANYVVKIAETTLNAFATATYVTAGFTTVYGPSTYTHTNSGWQEIVFTTPFVWDGTSNVIIEISHSGANSDDNANTYYTAGTENRLLFGTTGGPTLSKNRYNVVLKGGTGYKVTWSPTTDVYTDEAGTIPYAAGTAANKVYYKGQTEGYADLVASVSSGNACPLTKTYNVRTVVMTDAVAEDQEYCGTVPVSQLVATGQEGAAFKWYRQATGGVALVPTALVTSGSYFVTQIIGNCESTTRIPVQVSIKTKPSAPISPSRNICGTALLSDLEVTYDTENTLIWYDADQNPIVGDVALHTAVYYVSQSNAVCESDRTRVNISVNPVPGIPTVTTTQVYCGTARVSNLAIQVAPGAVANWYATLESTTVLSPNDFLTTRTYYVAQSSNGCMSDRVAVNVAVYETVAVPVAQNQNFCTTTATVRDLQATLLPGAQVNWYNVASGGTALSANQTLSSGLYYVSQKIGDCESARVRIGVNIVSNNTAPNAYAQSFCGVAKVRELHVTVGTGMIVKWYTQAQAGTALADDTVLQTGTYYVSQSVYFCESPRKAVQITINPIPASPNGNAVQEFEELQNSVIANLILDKPNVIWYSSEEDALTGTNRLATNMPLINGDVYYGVVLSAAGCPSLPFAVTVKINPNLGVNDFDLTKLNYYPNPVKDILTITYKETISKVEVYALNGQRVLTMNTSDNLVLVDMSRLASATYVVKIYSEDQSQFIKIIKN